MYVKLKLFYFSLIEVGLCLILWALVLDYPTFVADPENSVFEVILIYGIFAVGIIGMGVAIVRLLQGKVPMHSIEEEGTLTELSVIRLLKNHPSFIVPAILTTILPLLIVGGSMLAPELVGQPYTTLIAPLLSYNLLLGMFAFFFLVVFVIVMLQIWGILLAGELLQRHFKPETHNMFVHMVKNTIFALPFAIVYTLVFIFVALLRRKKSKATMSEALKTTGIVAMLQVVKYYIYTNLSTLAFEDRYTYATLRESAQYVRANAGRLLAVFANTMLVSGVAFLYLFVLVVWADKLPLFTEDVVFALVFVLGAIIFSWVVFVEQILFLLNFIQIRHPQYNVYPLVGQQQPIAVSPVSLESLKR